MPPQRDEDREVAGQGTVPQPSPVRRAWPRGRVEGWLFDRSAVGRIGLSVSMLLPPAKPGFEDWLGPDSSSTAARHWRSEIVGFHANMMVRYAASMRQRVDVDALWRSARQQMLLAYEGEPQQRGDQQPHQSQVAAMAMEVAAGAVQAKALPSIGASGHKGP